MSSLLEDFEQLQELQKIFQNCPVNFNIQVLIDERRTPERIDSMLSLNKPFLGLIMSIKDRCSPGALLDASEDIRMGLIT